MVADIVNFMNNFVAVWWILHLKPSLQQREQQELLSRPALSQVKLFDEDEEESLR